MSLIKKNLKITVFTKSDFGFLPPLSPGTALWKQGRRIMTSFFLISSAFYISFLHEREAKGYSSQNYN